MNWPLIIALLLALGIIIGNIMLIRQSANMKLPKPKKPYAKWDDDEEPSPPPAKIDPAKQDQKPNNPE
ncbi:DUF2897 family protein [Chromatiaceae bacterium AAb-1]|jgi:hypothetical protein|nr:DUF2897 family protein [Chromatiaceae bacterium AAb-1]